MTPEAVTRAAEDADCAAHIVRDRHGHHTITVFKLDSHGVAYEQPLATFHALRQAYNFLRES